MKEKISKIRNRVRNKYSFCVSCFASKQGRPMTATNLATGSTCIATSGDGKWTSIREMKEEKLIVNS